MTLTTHALVGAAAASLFPEYPYAAFAAGFASHFLIDVLPHWDYVEYLPSFRVNEDSPIDHDVVIGKEFLRDLCVMGGDALLGALLTLLIFGGWLHVPVAVAFIGAGAGIFPDLLQFIYFKTRKTLLGPPLEILQGFHQRIQEGKEHREWDAKRGLGYQAALVLAIVATVRFFQ